MQMCADAPEAIADAVLATVEESLEGAQLASEEPNDGSSTRASNAMTTSNLLMNPCAASAAAMSAPTENPLPRRHSYVGSHVEVRGDGWGGGGGCYVGVVTEADAATFTVVVPAGRARWSETHVLRQYCTMLRPEPALDVAMKPKKC